MSVRDLLVDQGKKLASSSLVLRLVSNDRVMKVATGVMDARSRLRAVAEKVAEAGDILVNGHAMPNIDSTLTQGRGCGKSLAAHRSRARRATIAHARARCLSATTNVSVLATAPSRCRWRRRS